jgi:hypothetical protein
MAITVRFPVTVHANVLRLAFEVAAQQNTAVQIETFYRFIDGPNAQIDCDTEADLRKLVEAQRAAPVEG